MLNVSLQRRKIWNGTVPKVCDMLCLGVVRSLSLLRCGERRVFHRLRRLRLWPWRGEVWAEVVDGGGYCWETKLRTSSSSVDCAEDDGADGELRWKRLEV